MNNLNILDIKAMEIFNGRGFPAIEVTIKLENGLLIKASGPSGTSTSRYEALEIRDGGTRLMGRGVHQAVENIEKIIAPELRGKDATAQRELDQILIDLDGTEQKNRLGGNATTAVSLALAKAGAAVTKLPLYRYLGGMGSNRLPILSPNLISGSITAGNELDFEDYLIVPYGFDTIQDSIVACVEVFHELYAILRKMFGQVPQITALSPNLKSNEEAFDILSSAIQKAGYTGKIGFGIDVASGLIYDENLNVYKLREKQVTSDELIDYYKELIEQYPIIFIEDGLHENDYAGFAEMRKKLSCLIIGDDLFATNKCRLDFGVMHGAATSVLLKINQIGTVSEALDFAYYAKNNGYSVVSSVRSGETEESAQVDIAIAAGAMLMKVGSPIRGEMITKYNRLLAIESELGKNCIFNGKDFITMFNRIYHKNY